MGTSWGSFGELFRDLFLFRGALDLKMNAFFGDLFSDTLFSRFFWIFRAPWTQKPWISRGNGSENHTFARIGIFTVLVPIWGPFWKAKRTQNHVLAHFGGPW